MSCLDSFEISEITPGPFFMELECTTVMQIRIPRVLEDGTTGRVLEDGTTERVLEGAPPV